MCSEYEDGYSYLKKDTSIRCWEGNHTVFALSIGITIIFLSLIVFPIVIRNRLNHIKGKYGDEGNLKFYGIFYIGLIDNAYYWEIIIVTFRKIALVIIASVLPSTAQHYKVCFSFTLNC